MQFNPRVPDLRNKAKFVSMNGKIVPRQAWHTIASPNPISLGEGLSSSAQNTISMDAQLELARMSRIINYLDRQKPSNKAQAETLETLKEAIQQQAQGASSEQIDKVIEKIDELVLRSTPIDMNDTMGTTETDRLDDAITQIELLQNNLQDIGNLLGQNSNMNRPHDPQPMEPEEELVEDPEDSMDSEIPETPPIDPLPFEAYPSTPEKPLQSAQEVPFSPASPAPTESWNLFNRSPRSSSESIMFKNWKQSHPHVSVRLAKGKEIQVGDWVVGKTKKFQNNPDTWLFQPREVLETLPDKKIKLASTGNGTRNESVVVNRKNFYVLEPAVAAGDLSFPSANFHVSSERAFFDWIAGTL